MSGTRLMPVLASPYPGLRPFKTHEEAIFFGRHEQISDTLRRLETCRLLTVVGASGCGKSSLVRAGLLPALKEGLLFDAGSEWKTVTLRAGSDPYCELARALGETLPVPRARDPNQWRSFIHAMLLSGDSGLIRVVNEAGLPPGSNVLVLVDQFEELFRFRNPARRKGHDKAEKQRSMYEERNTANAFVNMLLETVSRQDCSGGVSGSLGTRRTTPGLMPRHPIFVVLTMRSEFLGRCDAFLGLPEAVSRSQFLTPRMTREQLKDAIVRPLELFGAVAQPALVNRILNDVGTDPDSLPLMQHALLRTWQNATHRAIQQRGRNEQPLALEVVDYEKAGGLQNALSIHADEAYAELRRDPALGELYQHVAQRLFVLLCRQTGEGVLVRHPIRVAEAAEAIGVSNEIIVHVAAAFCKEGRNFITPFGADQDVKPDSTLDISHESLIRNWVTFKGWIKTEMRSAADYAWVLQAAERWENGGELFYGANLKGALAWKQRTNPSPDWAARYGGDFDLAMRFLRVSRKQHQRWSIARMALFGVLVLAAILYGIQQQHEIETQAKLWTATEQLREIGQTAKRQSENFFRQAEQLLKEKANPRAQALALTQLSRSVERDRTNIAAVEATCTVLLNHTWCPPLTPPLRYNSDSAILAATFDPDGDRSRLLAVCQDGWLLTSDEHGASLVQKQRLSGAANAKKVRLISASFSPDGRALLLIWPQEAGTSQDPGRKVVQFCRLVNGRYQPREALDISSYSILNTIGWSADGKIVTLIPLRWDGTGPCLAFYSDGTSYQSVDRPFDGSPVTAVGFDPGASVIATASTDGSLQLWEWAQGRFAKLPNAPNSYSGYILPGRPYIRSAVFGRTKEELFAVTSGSSNEVQVQLVNIPKQTARILGSLAPKDQFPRLVLGPQTSDKQLMATSLYSRVSINHSSAWNLDKAIAEPICFAGTTATPVFDLTGSRLLTLSGAIWLAPDTVQVWDVSMSVKGENSGTFNAEGKPAPPWLANLARAVSGIPRTWDTDNDATLLSDVLAKADPGTIYPPYDRVWSHFFPEQATGKR